MRKRKNQDQDPNNKLVPPSLIEGGGIGGVQMQQAKMFSWAGRILSILSIGFLLSFIIGEGLPPITLQSICFPFGVIIGLLIAWKKEGLGGIIALAGLVGFYAVNYISVQSFPKGVWFFLFALPGVFFLLSSLLTTGSIK